MPDISFFEGTKMLASTLGISEIIVIFVYLFFVLYLGWLGYTRTKTAADFLIAGRKTHPFIMALSYGATFISTSAIVGFGGVAALFGMSVLWLTVCNIFIGIFIAFVVLGPFVRRMGHHLDAHTFPELLGRRYDSKFIQVFAGLIIFLFIPLYAAAVLIGGSEFLSTEFGIDYNVALLVFGLIVAAYVVFGGLKGVMYTDTLQGAIMFVGMTILLIFAYVKVGGWIKGHENLTSLAPLVPGTLREMGHRGWTAMPAFGFGDKKYDLWWIVVSTITLGVGIGVLAQPQLMVRFMTVKSSREINRAVGVGGVFILFMTGIAFTVGALSNVYFTKYGKPISGHVIKNIDAEKKQAIIQVAKQDGDKWVDVVDDKGQPKKAPVVLTDNNPGTMTIDGKSVPVVQGRSISIVYAGGNSDQIIPLFITSAMPKWFTIVFMLTLLSAAMSTLSSQFHVIGTSIGRDVYEQITGKHGQSMGITRTGIVVGIIIALLWGFYARDPHGGYIIARATAIFFGLCASAFLPAFIGGLFWKRMTKTGAIISMVFGFVFTAFWLLFIKAKEAGDIGLVQKITGGKTSILWNHPNWPVVDPIVVALPISILVAITVSLITKPPSKEHIEKCFKKI